MCANRREKRQDLEKRHGSVDHPVIFDVGADPDPD
jgi:hypothetical protein